MSTARRQRRGFTLLEVMIAIGIMVVSLVILLEMQASAVQMTWEADRIVTATQLASDKLSEVRMFVEREGFTDDDVFEEGEFDDFGDEVLNISLDELEEYHWEYLIAPIDLELATDLTSTANNLASTLGGTPDSSSAPPIPDMGGFVSEDMIAQMLDPFIREVRVRVWWGEDLEEAEELGNEVVVTTHIINPAGNMLGAAGLGGGGGGGGAGGAGGGGGNPFAPNAGGGGGAGFGPGLGGAGGGARGGARPARPTRNLGAGRR